MKSVLGFRRTASWQLLSVLWRANRRLAALWWAFIAVRGVLPALFTLATGALVGAVVHGQSALPAALLVGLVFLAMNTLAPLHETVGGNLGDWAGSYLEDRLLTGSLQPPGLAHLEDADLAVALEKVRTFDTGRFGPPLSAAMSHTGSGFVVWAGGLASALLLFGYRWWAPPLLIGAWLGTHVLLREASRWRMFYDEGPVTKSQRRAGYEYRLAVDAPAAKEIRLFSLGGWVVDRVMAVRRVVTETMLEEQRLRTGPVRWGLLMIVAAYGLICWSLARDAVAGALSLSALVVFAQAAIGAAAIGFGEVDWWFRGSAVPVPELLSLGGRMAEVGNLTLGSRSAEGLPSDRLELRGVTFAYRGGPQILDGIDLSIPAGTSLAIVGQNGAGKTTLAKLLCRFYDPTGGAILADGVDLKEFEIDSWRAQVAAVFQDFVRFELSLRDNVAPGGAPDEVVAAALRRAHAEGLAELDTTLNRAYEGGTDLSGGQWQRVALARALSQVQLGARLVLLDEPTAQLDVRGEAEIFDSLLEATRGLTTVLISHRFSTVRHADRICVLEHGGIVELGSHDELMARGGRYRTMFDLQASRFEEPLEDVAEV